MSSKDQPTYPLPELSALTRPFWEGCQNQELKIAVCGQCSHRFMPGVPNCPKCWSADFS
ncbi:MAG: zinc ribbon domain-containing protein, partial [Pseudomonadales bacterium]